MKTELFENVPHTGGIWKRRPHVSVWIENILKAKLFENDEVAIIMTFPRSSFTQTQIQNDRRIAVFSNL